MCEQHYTKRLYFFDYMGDPCEVPTWYYEKYPTLLEPAQTSADPNIYRMVTMKKEQYGF